MLHASRINNWNVKISYNEVFIYFTNYSIIILKFVLPLQVSGHNIVLVLWPFTTAK
jgi:hypothetical protein